MSTRATAFATKQTEQELRHADDTAGCTLAISRCAPVKPTRRYRADIRPRKDRPRHYEARVG